LLEKKGPKKEKANRVNRTLPISTQSRIRLYNNKSKLAFTFSLDLLLTSFLSALQQKEKVSLEEEYHYNNNNKRNINNHTLSPSQINFSKYVSIR
jgi:hypothetical protein